ncbi:helix-turn-helix transcriptional regulator [Evansella sp. LMS18]|uniref:helix-turn-helix domain-containing protein n=1 Tax=Evansella sp. LMS18 TaxID=2924033 RepID=UPI0020D0E049|nr:helix-turn-helix domain-containing protein [Evansella sp. LMS18]UTR08885.1 helix-turn-helix transcriptional regulator [Evansella sp. LMS18]
MHIGNRLKKIRTLKGVPQSKVCKGIVSPSHYSNIESGRYEASEDILESIAERLHVPTKYLVGIHDDSPTTSELLLDYENLVEQDTEKADAFFEKRKKQLEYIPSIHQEMEYLLIRCMHLLKNLEISKAEHSHEEVSFYLQDENLGALSSKTNYKYYYITGLLYFYQRQYLESYNNFNKALKFATTNQYQARILFNLALNCYNINDIHKALLYTQDAKEIYMDQHLWKETIEAYILLGVLNIEIEDFNSAKDVLKKGLSLAKEKDLQVHSAKILHNLGVIHFKTKEYESSLSYFNESLEIKTQYNHSEIFITHLAILMVYLEMQNFRQLILQLKEAKQISGNKIEDYQLKVIEAKMEYLLFNTQKYNELMEECLDYFYSHQIWNEVIDSAKHFSDFHYENRRYKKAHYYLKMELEAVNKIYKERF